MQLIVTYIAAESEKMPTCVYINNKRAHQSQGRAVASAPLPRPVYQLFMNFPRSVGCVHGCIVNVRETDALVALDSLVFVCKNSTANEMTDRLVRELRCTRLYATRVR